MAQASDVLAVAVREIGTVEQSGNRQKYGKAYGMDGVYWCMQFVWWCFQQVDKTLFMDGGKTASCGELMRWAQAHGQWVTTGYRPGDVLIYDFPGTAYKTDHCGICESVSGQYDLWDTAEKIVATSASSINSALESQITYWDSYNQNLESLNARAADIDGLSAVIASFADGSKDSVNAIAGMASASDADLAKMVQNYQELQEAQKTTSESMADLETGMSNAMDEIAQNVADSVADMNLSDEAKESAQATIQGFVDGAEGMLPRVQTVFSKIASDASTALAGAGGSYSGNIPGYAVGTESAAPGFAIVGENGPELVYFNGGETVLTAPETRAAFDEAQQFTQIVSKNALDFAAIQQAAGLSENSMQTFYHDWTVYNEYEALTANTAASAEVVPASSFTHSEGSPISINFAPVYNFSGVSDTQQFESLLTSHDDDMREYILGVVEEAEHDKFRRAYA